MKKLKLNLDEIKVESFETVTKKENHIGTVIGYLTAPAPTQETCNENNCGTVGCTIFCNGTALYCPSAWWCDSMVQTCAWCG